MRTVQGNRIYFLDNLRTFIIFLVVLFHVGGVYESYGDWQEFWLVDDPDTSELSGFLNIILDIFMMPALFFISGYLAPVSLRKKGRWAFVTSKLRRLMIPWLVAVFTLIPLYKVIFLYSRDLPQQHWTSYFYFSKDIIYVGMGWLWFLPVLFVFSIVYVLLAVPVNVSFKRAAGFVFAASLITSLIFDLAEARGWTHTPLIDFQNERVLMYGFVFLAGTLAYHQQVFAAASQRPAFYRIARYTFWIPFIIYMIFLVRRTDAEDAGLDPSLLDKTGYWIGFYLTLVSILYVLFVYFWRHFNHSGALWSELNRNSYNVYLIHVVVLGALALPLLDASMPGVVKYLIVTALTYVICNGLLSLRRRITQPQNRVFAFTRFSEKP